VTVYLKCPKCDAISGDAWTQCNKRCPVKSSPHYDPEAEKEFGSLEVSVQPLDEFIKDFR